ncbi:hypothetical protein [Catenulispora rubra]|uniref:hypothetical protein n=1 Tax=Catenulispora rubra TaxID=280293 RepID=UPI0018924B18|nr:hypothetical protein [Catenulispora rubra]
MHLLVCGTAGSGRRRRGPKLGEQQGGDLGVAVAVAGAGAVAVASWPAWFR